MLDYDEMWKRACDIGTAKAKTLWPDIEKQAELSKQIALFEFQRMAGMPRQSKRFNSKIPQEQ